MKIHKTPTETQHRVFNGDKDTGFHGFGTRWWANPECPLSYHYLGLDAMYEAPYFGPGRGHPTWGDTENLYLYTQVVFTKVVGKPFRSVLELGTGGGEFTQRFHDADLDFVAVEGTQAGVDHLLKAGIPPDRILHANLKFLKPVGRKFDLVMCTEVAEHIEPWFASKVVDNCVIHADMVWFSAARGDAPPHYHHMNEAPIEAWDRIFAHFGFDRHVELDRRFGRADRLYLAPGVVTVES